MVRAGLGAEDARVLEQRGERRLDEAGGGEMHAVAPGRHGRGREGLRLLGPRRRRRRSRRRPRRRVHHRAVGCGAGPRRQLPEAPAAVAEERGRVRGVAGLGRGRGRGGGAEARGEAEAEAVEGARRRRRSGRRRGGVGWLSRSRREEFLEAFGFGIFLCPVRHACPPFRSIFLFYLLRMLLPQPLLASWRNVLFALGASSFHR